MKNIIVFFMCLGLIISASAQSVIFEEAFESFFDCPSGCTRGYINEFNCVSSWAVSHGTPHHEYIASVGNSYMGMISKLSGNNNYGEGIFSRPIDGLIPGNSYKICFNYTTEGVEWDNFNGGDLKMLLADPSEMVHNPSGQNNYENCYDYLPDVSSSQEIVSQTAPELNGEWLSAEFYFTVEGNETPCLWIYSESNKEGIFRVDDIKISLDCSSSNDIIFDSPDIINHEVYLATNEIECGTNNTIGYIEPDPDGEIIFRAGNSITLLPNFYADPNYYGRFRAYIGSCEEVFCGEYENLDLRSMETSSSFVGSEEQQFNPFSILKNDYQGDLKIIPNPNNGEFSVLIPDSFSNHENITISIYNSLGKMVRSFNNVTDRSLSINGLSQGVYTVVLQQENNSTHLTQRVVVVRN